MSYTFFTQQIRKKKQTSLPRLTPALLAQRPVYGLPVGAHPGGAPARLGGGAAPVGGVAVPERRHTRPWGCCCCLTLNPQRQG